LVGLHVQDDEVGEEAVAPDGFLVVIEQKLKSSKGDSKLFY
jgi:hypothetical protein